MTTQIEIPTLTTERLILRAPTAQDFEGYAEILSSDRAVFLRGPYSRSAAWKDYCLSVAEWILNDLGPLSIIWNDRFAGLVGISVHPEFPEPEMGWVVSADAEGKGVAFEAAVAMARWATSARTLPSLVSYIWSGNTRAESLALKLGGLRDPQAAQPWPGALVYRYSLAPNVFKSERSPS